MPTTERQKSGAGKTRELQQMTEKYRANKRLKEQNERKKREEERQTNTVQDRKLAFLTNIIYSSGLDMKKVAAKIGTTQQALSWCFSVKDDCRLSRAEEIVNAVGCKLQVTIKKGQNSALAIVETKLTGNNNGVKFSIEGSEAGKIHKCNPKMPEYVNLCPSGARMYWLAQYLPSVGTPITEMMNDCELDLSSLRYIFAKDDIKISQIFQIAKGTGGEIVWKITKKSK